MPNGSKLDVKFFASGYCTAAETLLNLPNATGKRKFYATWCLISHYKLGHILFDTGYSEAFYTASRSFPDKIYSLVTPVKIDNSNSARMILTNLGIPPETITYIIISHFHADHICGLNDFPNAVFICSNSSFDQINRLNGLKAVRKGLLKKLLPDDFASRLLFVEEISELKYDGSFDLTFFKLFNLSEIQLVRLPGHAKGMLGLLAETDEMKIFFASDAAWDCDMLKRQILPKPIVKLFFDSWQQYKETYFKLLSYKLCNPDTLMLFTHCPATLNYISNVV